MKGEQIGVCSVNISNVMFNCLFDVYLNFIFFLGTCLELCLEIKERTKFLYRPGRKAY